MDWLQDWCATNGGEIVGATIAVLVGFVASELFAARKERRERARVRALIAEEVALNYARVEAMREHLDDNEDKEVQLDVALGPRPSFTDMTTSILLSRVPDALSQQESQRLLQLQSDLNTLVSIWESQRNAHQADVLTIPPPDEHVVGLSGMIEQTRMRVTAGPTILKSFVKLHWPKYIQTLQQIVDRDVDLADCILLDSR